STPRAGPARADPTAAALRAARELVRGQPFHECYHWWIDIALVETMRAEIVDTAGLLAQLELAAGDPQAAGRAARIGLSAETAAEPLWRALMQAEHAAGNLAGVTDAWTGCLDAVTEIAPGGEPHPDTERLVRELSRARRLPRATCPAQLPDPPGRAVVPARLISHLRSSRPLPWTAGTPPLSGRTPGARRCWPRAPPPRQ